MNEKQPGIAKSIGIFVGVYFSLLLGVGYLLQALGRKSGSSANMMIIVIAVTIAGRWFARRHRRPYTRYEYFAVVIGTVGFDVFLQLFFIWLVLGASAFAGKWGGVIFILIVHAALIAIGFSTFVLNRYFSTSPRSRLNPESSNSSKVRF
jgi:hypothetical protein